MQPAQQFEAATRQAFRFYGVLFFGFAAIGAAILFILASLPASALVTLGLALASLATCGAGTVGAVAFLASLPGFRGDDAFRHN